MWVHLTMNIYFQICLYWCVRSHSHLGGQILSESVIFVSVSPSQVYTLKHGTSTEWACSLSLVHQDIPAALPLISRQSARLPGELMITAGSILFIFGWTSLLHLSTVFYWKSNHLATNFHHQQHNLWWSWGNNGAGLVSSFSDVLICRSVWCLATV